MPRMTHAAPAQKVVASTLASAVATIVVWAMNTYALEPDMPDYIVGAVLTVCTAITGYLTPPARRDTIADA